MHSACEYYGLNPMTPNHESWRHGHAAGSNGFIISELGEGRKIEVREADAYFFPDSACLPNRMVATSSEPLRNNLRLTTPGPLT